MLLAVDIGNSSIGLGVFDDAGNLCFRSGISATIDRSEDEYAILIDSLFRLNGIDNQSVESAILSSVVPGLTHKLTAAVSKVFGVTPQIVGRGLRTGFHIRMDVPTEVGADLIANTAAVLALYSAPAMILDFGTLTTVSVINRSRAFTGGCILPGVASSLDTVRGRGAQLPEVTLSSPPQAIGRNTADCIRAGLIFGSAAAVDGLIDRYLAELEIPPEEMHLIATGGLAPLILEHMTHEVTYHPDLTLYGLFALHSVNQSVPKR